MFFERSVKYACMLECKLIVECFTYQVCLANSTPTIYGNKLRCIGMKYIQQFILFFFTTYEHGLSNLWINYECKFTLFFWMTLMN